MPDPLRRLTSFDELYAASGQDPFILHDVPSTLTAAAYALGDAVAFVARRIHTRRVGLAAIGSRDQLDTLLGALAAASVVAELGLTDISVPYESRALLDKQFHVGPGGDWDWMWTTAAPGPVPEEVRIVDLAGEDLIEIAQLLAATSPQTQARPGERDGEHWIGMRGADGALIACASMEPNGAGRPRLSGVAVDPAHRGRHLGLAMTAALTRRAVASEGVCTLEMFSDNDAARRVYHGLGYRTAYAWASRALLPS